MLGMAGCDVWEAMHGSPVEAERRELLHEPGGVRGGVVERNLVTARL